MPEVTKKQTLLDRIYNSYILGTISQEQYDRAMLIINGLSFHETMVFAPTAQSFMAEGNVMGFVLGLSDSEINSILEEAMKLQ